MTTAVVVLVVLVLTAAGLVWPAKGESWKWSRSVSEKKPPDRTAPAAAPSSLEGVLVSQLIAHEISPVQYRHAVARLAQRDDEVNPLATPDDNPPTASR